MKEEGVQSRVALSTHSTLQLSVCPSLCLSRARPLDPSPSVAGSPIRSTHLDKMEFVKWVAALAAVRLQVQTSNRTVRELKSLKPRRISVLLSLIFVSPAGITCCLSTR